MKKFKITSLIVFIIISSSILATGDHNTKAIKTAQIIKINNEFLDAIKKDKYLELVKILPKHKKQLNKQTISTGFHMAAYSKNYLILSVLIRNFQKSNILRKEIGYILNILIEIGNFKFISTLLRSKTIKNLAEKNAPDVLNNYKLIKRTHNKFIRAIKEEDIQTINEMLKKEPLKNITLKYALSNSIKTQNISILKLLIEYLINNNKIQILIEKIIPVIETFINLKLNVFALDLLKEKRIKKAISHNQTYIKNLCDIAISTNNPEILDCLGKIGKNSANFLFIRSIKKDQPNLLKQFLKEQDFIKLINKKTLNNTLILIVEKDQKEILSLILENNYLSNLINEYGANNSFISTNTQKDDDLTNILLSSKKIKSLISIGTFISTLYSNNINAIKKLLELPTIITNTTQAIEILQISSKLSSKKTDLIIESILFKKLINKQIVGIILIHAARTNNTDFINTVLTEYKNKITLNDFNYSLVSSTENGNCEVLETLLQDDSLINFIDYDTANNLIILASDNHIKCLQSILKQNTILEFIDEDGFERALIGAARQGFLEVVKYLINDKNLEKFKTEEIIANAISQAKIGKQIEVIDFLENLKISSPEQSGRKLLRSTLY